MGVLRSSTALIAVATGLAAAIVVTLGLQAIRQDAEEQDLHRTIATLQTLVDDVEDITENLTEAEAARRGYLLTQGNAALLPGYEAAIARIGITMRSLRGYAAAHPEEAMRLREIDVSVAVKLAELAESLALAQAGRTDQAIRILAEDPGRLEMVALRGIVETLTQEKSGQIRALLADSEAARRNRNRVVLAIAVFGLAVSGIGLLVLLHSQRLAERREREAEEVLSRLRLLADTLPGLVSYLDRDARYQFMNRRYRDWFGIDPDASIGSTPEDVAGPEAGRIYRGWVALALAGEPVSRENVAPFEHGGARPVRCYLLPDRDAEGKVRGVVSLTLDVTQEYEARQALEVARDQAVEAARAKSRFLAAASHDLRQPLYALMLFASALERRLKQTDVADLVANIQQASRTMHSMFSALLDISKLDAGIVAPRIGVFPVADPIAKVAAEFRDRAIAKGLDFRIVRSSAAVQTDPDLLESILRNLLSNAVKFTARGRILVGCRRLSDRLRIEVHDTGPGIAGNRTELLFQEFAQGDARADSAETGLGLGLAIVRRLANLLGHELSVNSIPGRGSCFAVSVPMLVSVSAPGRASSPQPAPHARLEGRRVLIVEDEPDVRGALARLLTDWGIDVVEAPDSETALRTLAVGRPPDLVLADYNLGPGGNGIDLMRQIADRLGRRVPTLVVTGATGPETLVALKQSGIPWATKPLDPLTLRNRITAALGPGTEAT